MKEDNKQLVIHIDDIRSSVINVALCPRINAGIACRHELKPSSYNVAQNTTEIRPKPRREAQILLIIPFFLTGSESNETKRLCKGNGLTKI